MATPAKHLRPVTMAAGGEGTFPPDGGDVALVAALFGINLVPVLGTILRFGNWGSGTAGIAAGCAMLTGRELAFQLREILRARRGRSR